MDHAPGEGRLVQAIDGPMIARSRELDEPVAPASTDLGEPCYWSTPDGHAVTGFGVAARLEATGPHRFHEIRSLAARTLETIDFDGPIVARPRAFGGGAFHESHVATDPWTGFAPAAFVIPRVMITRHPEATWLTVVGEQTTGVDLETVAEQLQGTDPEPALPAITDRSVAMSRPDWTDGVRAALEHIDDGTIEKVVLAQALSVTLDGELPVRTLLEGLGERYPNCYRFLQGGDPGQFFGAPPERLVRKQGQRLETEALAGSIERGDSTAEDDALARKMAESEKVAREHDLVVEAITERLEPLVADLEIGESGTRRLATIQHRRTPIEATLDDGQHVLDVVDALHPTPAVGGVPLAAAWAAIQRTEQFDRGWYAAPIGWFDAAGDGEFTVGIRSGLARDRSLTLFAGNGVVAESDPDEEWAEVKLKFRPILDELE